MALRPQYSVVRFIFPLFLQDAASCMQLKHTDWIPDTFDPHSRVCGSLFFFFFETEGRQTQPTPNELRVCGSQSAIETLTLSPLLFHIYINISIYISTGGVQGGSKVRGMHHPSHWGDSQQLHPKGSRIQGTTACG